MHESVDIVLRLGASVLTGAAIGINRDLANKPIGMRTLALVALGAASPFAEPAPIVPACPDCLDVFPGHRAWCGVMRAAADARICGRSVDELAAGGPRIWRCVRDKGHGGACG